MTTDETVTQAWSALQAELWALNQVLTDAKRKRINIYTDSRYAFATLHDHGAIYKERGLLTAGGKEIKIIEEILQLLEAVWKPFKMAVIHCKGHQREINPVGRGNQFANQAVKEMATQLNPTGGPEPVSKVLLASELPPSLSCTKEEDQGALDEGGTKGKGGWWTLPDQRLFVPSNIAVQLVNNTMRQLS